jgi:hypothetical protein
MAARGAEGPTAACRSTATGTVMAVLGRAGKVAASAHSNAAGSDSPGCPVQFGLWLPSPPSPINYKESHSQDDQDLAARKLIPWRPIGAAATSIGVPVGIGLLHPALGAAVFLVELAVSLIILGTALFGAKEYSERAFRLLRWFANHPEPDAPPDTTTGKAISPTLRRSPRTMNNAGP